MSVLEHLARRGEAVEAALAEYVPALTAGAEAPRLIDAMRYSLEAGGKRLRPALVLDACECVGGRAEWAMPTACAFECIHTYSLIHDDLPCMDDDDLRRGRPSCHRQFDEATALLAGDALQTLAFALIAYNGEQTAVGAQRALAVVRELAEAAGAPGMVGGQTLDLQAEHQAPTAAGVEAIHLRKTTALLRAAVRCGAVLGGGDAAALEAFGRYGTALGLAFQIVDDILDIVGEEAAIGKPVGSDLAHQKATWPAVHGLDASRAKVTELVAEAHAALEAFGERAAHLAGLADFVAERQY